MFADIPRRFYDQSLKARGSNVIERLNFLVGWYEKTSKNSASDGFQREFLSVMGSISDELRSLVGQEDAEQAVQDVRSYLSSAHDKYVMSKSSPEREAYAYLCVELSGIIG